MFTQSDANEMLREDQRRRRQEMTMTGKWTTADAVAMCVAIEAICPKFGCHVALTGGLLYKDGERKDADILFYRIRQVEEVEVDGLFRALGKIGLVRTSGFGWCYKATYRGKPVDCFFPEENDGEYVSEPDAFGMTTEDAKAMIAADCMMSGAL